MKFAAGIDGPGGGEALARTLAARSARRLRRVRRLLAAAPVPVPRARRVLDQLAAALGPLPPEARVRVLTGPDVRGFLSEVETWAGIDRLARALGGRGGGGTASGRHAASRGATGEERRRLVTRLFDRVCGTPHLTSLVPGGRLDAAFPGRCRRLARVRLDEAVSDLSALVLGLRLAWPGASGVTADLRFAEDAEQGRPGNRIDLGMVGGASGALSILPASRRGPSGGRRRVRATLFGRTLVLRRPGGPAAVFPAAGSGLELPGDRPGRGSLRLPCRPAIPGSSILLAPGVTAGPGRLRVGRQVPGLESRLARALRILWIAWPRALREVELRTRMVVPIREPGTVSYSMAARPGVSFINVAGKSIVDLADDLLHETAHHRLHDLEEVVRLLRPGPRTTEVQAFDSPWRGTRRPLRGVLHGVYTFRFRAELFRRILRLARRRPRLAAAAIGRRGLAFVRRELPRERAMIDAALRDLGRAARAGLLTRDGIGLLRSMREDDLGRED